mmetsp:Transcript_12392/g.38554  ORF Transcript_12392/g.38554 Transcript_12392/m.38554 type:complete len:225 (+) Transcript_12392:849-1523(+)
MPRRAGLGQLPFDALEERGLLAADVRAGAEHHLELEAPLGDGRVDDGGVPLEGRLDGRLEVLVLVAQVHVALRRADRLRGEAGADEHAHAAGGVLQQVEVLVRVRQPLVRVDDEVLGRPVGRLRVAHRAPLEVRWETGAAAATQAGRLQLLDQRVGVHGEEFARHGALDAGRVGRHRGQLLGRRLEVGEEGRRLRGETGHAEDVELGGGRVDGGRVLVLGELLG